MNIEYCFLLVLPGVHTFSCEQCAKPHKSRRTDRDLALLYNVNVPYERCFLRAHFLKPTLPGEIQYFLNKVFNIPICFFLKTD